MYYLQNIITKEFYRNSVLDAGFNTIGEETVKSKKDAYQIKNYIAAEKIINFDVLNTFEWRIV